MKNILLITSMLILLIQQTIAHAEDIVIEAATGWGIDKYIVDGLSNSSGPIVLNSLTLKDNSQLYLENDLELIVSKLTVGKNVRIIGIQPIAQSGINYSSAPSRRTHMQEAGTNGLDGKNGESGHKGINVRIKADEFFYQGVSFETFGGNGGGGGNGQQGGKGSNAECPIADAGNGGNGGKGGNGGNGGDAGSLLISFNSINNSDDAIPTAGDSSSSWGWSGKGIYWIATGGKGGGAGLGGKGGDGGNSADCGLTKPSGGDRGSTGAAGIPGNDGKSFDTNTVEWLKFN